MDSSRRPPTRSERSQLGRALTACWLAAATVLGVSPQRVLARDYAVITNPRVPVDEISSGTLRRLFTLERQFWKPGLPAIPLLPPNGSRTRAFLLSRVIRTDESGLRRMILEKLYRAEIDLAPKVTSEEDDAIAFVASSSGLFALVPATRAKGRPVKVLRIDGKLPGVAGYPLAD